MDDRERDFAAAVTDLSETLEELRTELREPPKGPLGLPRPPTPSELLRFTEGYTIPAVIALLEASIKALEVLAAALRVADGRPLDAARGRPGGRSGMSSTRAIGQAGRDRLAASSRETLQRLDDALAELQSAAAGDPSNPELQRLLEEARELRAEVDDRLSAAMAEDSSEARSDDTEMSDDPLSEPNDDAVGIDVDEELRSIKQDVQSDTQADRTSDESDSEASPNPEDTNDRGQNPD